MSWSPHLNPAPWRDDDERRRVAVQRAPACGIGAALRSNFPLAPLPAEFQRLLDRLG